MRSALYLLLIAGRAPLQWQKDYPTRGQADEFLHDYVEKRLPQYGANDVLYAVDASRNYDPSPKSRRSRLL